MSESIGGTFQPGTSDSDYEVAKYVHPRDEGEDRVSEDTITDTKKAFLAALAKAQGAFEPIIKDKRVIIRPRDSAAYEFEYATLAEILTKTRKALSENGLSLRTKLVPSDGGLWLQSILAHADGHEDVSEISLNADGDIKQFGGRITYLRRYLIGPQIGISSEDDQDDDGAEPRTPAPPAAARAAPQRKVTPAPKPPSSPPTDIVEPPLETAVPAQVLRPMAAADVVVSTKIQASQAKWLRMKLESLFDPPGADAFMATHGVEVAAIEDITEAQFPVLRAALIAL